ncbi:MAG: hypothetical protein IJK58_09450 [Clostridia bacterium]|nr:hypothetical protein [Clostridia bacterium]
MHRNFRKKPKRGIITLETNSEHGVLAFYPRRRKRFKVNVPVDLDASYPFGKKRADKGFGSVGIVPFDP